MKIPLQTREWWYLASLVFVAAAIRILFVLQVYDNPFFNHPTSDAYYYDAQAQSIAEGDIIGNDVFFRAPGYPYWLGLIYALFGHSYLAVRIIQHSLGVISLVVLYLLGRRVFNVRVAVGATLLALLYPVLIYFEGQLLFDWFLTFLCLVWLLLLYDARDHATSWRWWIAGLFFGMICVTRPTFLPLAVPIFGYEVWRTKKTSGRRKAFATGVALTVGTGLVVLATAVRNYIVSGDIVLIASQGGINFYIGNNPQADGYTARIPSDIGASWEISEMSYHVEQQLGHRPTPSEESNFWYAKGIDFTLHRPLDAIALQIKKLYLFWNAIEIPNNLDFYTFSQYSWLLRVLPISFWIVGPLGILGMILGWKAHRGRTAIAFVLMYCAVMVMFFVCDRYRLPVIPLLCMFAAYALVALVEMIHGREYRKLVPAASVLLLLALFVNSNVYHLGKEEPVHQYYLLGLIKQKDGDTTGSVAEFERAAGYGKPIRNLYLHWGVGELLLGHSASAEEKFRRELVYHPNSYGALTNLSALFLNRRMLDSAIVYGNIAVEVKPFMPSAYVSLGQAHYLRHELAAAESVLSSGSRVCGGAFRYGNYLLAGIRLERGDIARAEAGYRAILSPPSARTEEGYEAEFLIPEEKRIGMDDQTLRAKAFYGLGHVFAARRELDSAVICFRNATQLSGLFADAWADLGVAFLQERRFGEADTAMRKALGLQAGNFKYWYNYGSLLGAMGRLVEAKEAFEKTLQLQPDFEPARSDLALVVRALARN